MEIPEFLVEGLVAVRDLSDDYYLYDEKHWQLKGESTGKVYRLGDSVRVQIVRIHREMRKMDFILVSESIAPSNKLTKRKHKKHRRR